MPTGIECNNSSRKFAPEYLSDVLFVAIDFEGTHVGRGSTISQIGVSILDTRGLPYASLLGQQVIRNKLYCISRASKFSRLEEKTKKVYRFGEVKWVLREDVVTTLATIFQDCSRFSILDQYSTLPRVKTEVNVMGYTSKSKRNRNIVLVGHGLHNELNIMDALGFRPGNHAKIIATMDTELLANQVEGWKQKTNLKSLIRSLELVPKFFHIPGASPRLRRFHNAGNDAAYTLEALLLLSVKWHAAAVDSSYAEWTRLSKLSAIDALTLITSSQENGRPTFKEQQSSGKQPSSFQEFHQQEKFAKKATSEAQETESFSKAFLLATARWQLFSKITDSNSDTNNKAGMALATFDEHALKLVGYDIYKAAICAMPLYLALAPTLRLDFGRSL